MLNIFKSYCEKTSILDDFRFYENREKSNIAKKSSKPTSTEMEMHQNDDFAVSLPLMHRHVQNSSS